MKKNAKILSILLCVAMLVGMIAMVATAQEAETLSTRDPSVATEGVLPVPSIGYYKGDGSFVSEHWSDATYGNPANVVDGLVDGDPGCHQYASCNFDPATLKQNGGELVPVIIFDMSENPVTLNGLNNWCYTTETWFIDFHVDVKTSADGAWETVGTYTDVNNPDNGYWTVGTDEYLYYFDKTVTAYEMRIVIDKFEGNPDGSLCIYQIYEIIPMVVETEEPEVPSEPSRPMYGILPTPGIGYYENDTFVSFIGEGNDAAKLVDGGNWDSVETGIFNSGDLKQHGGTKTAAILFDMGSDPLTMNGLEFIVNDPNRYVMKNFTVQAITTEGGDWETVCTITNAKYPNGQTATFMFGKTITAYKLRILADSFVANSDNSKWIIRFNEIAPMIVYDGPAIIKVPYASAVAGYYDDGRAWENFCASANASALFDGNKNSAAEIGSGSDSWVFGENNFVGMGGEITPAYILSLDEPTVLTEVEVMSDRDGRQYTAREMLVQIQDADGNWITVGEYKNANWTGSAIVTFDAVEAYAVRLLGLIINRVNDSTGNTAALWRATEVMLGCAEDAVDDGDTPVDPSEPETTEPSEPETTEPSEPDTSITADKVETLNNGDQIVIFYEDGKTVIGSSYADANNKKLSAIDATFSGEKLVVSEDMMILTVSIDADGYITFVTENGKYLTSGATGNSLTLTDEATAYSLWVLEETDGGFLVKNVNAAYNNNPQYLEFFNGGFTTYGNATASSMAPYTFNFYLVYASDVQDPTEPSEPEATEPEATEPEATEPEATEPEATEPEATEPEATEPEATEPEATEPEATEPEATEPEATEPDNDPSGKTGDITLSVLVGLLAISAIGCGIVLSKKKEF